MLLAEMPSFCVSVKPLRFKIFAVLPICVHLLLSAASGVLAKFSRFPAYRPRHYR